MTLSILLFTITPQIVEAETIDTAGDLLNNLNNLPDDVEVIDVCTVNQSVEPAGESLMDAENSEPTSMTSSGSSNKYYYNIGEYCPDYVTYSKYNLLSVVKKGDIIYESEGGFSITGHIAIVEGIFYRFNGTPYIRLIEAIDVGVVRSLLDDTRYNDKGVTVLRVSGATSTIIDAAVSFCVGELGSSYSLDLRKDTSAAEKDWYCSELVWAAYYNQGIDVEVSALGEPGVTPHDILKSDMTYVVTVKAL